MSEVQEFDGASVREAWWCSVCERWLIMPRAGWLGSRDGPVTYGWHYRSSPAVLCTGSVRTGRVVRCSRPDVVAAYAIGGHDALTCVPGPTAVELDRARHGHGADPDRPADA